MQVPCAHFFLTNPTNTPPRQHRLGKTFSAKNLSGSDSDTTYPDFFYHYLGTKFPLLEVLNLLMYLNIPIPYDLSLTDLWTLV
jgi:hypothetical protein